VVQDVPVFVGVQELPGNAGTWGKIECNPARLLDPEGASLCDVRSLPTALTLAWKAASQLLEPVCGIGDARVKRLDVARDFCEVERPDFFVRGLLGVKRPWARRSFTYSDPSRNCAETLAVGSGVGMVRLYDKHQETAKAPEGTLRWEVEARSAWLARLASIRTVEDINSESVAALAADRWDWSAMGVEVSAAQRVIEKVKRSGLSPAKQRSLLGHLMLVAAGERSELGKNQVTEYNRLQRDLGIVISPDMLGSSGGFVARLDWDSGREVIRAA
jgi:hypothetical protein